MNMERLKEFQAIFQNVPRLHDEGGVLMYSFHGKMDAMMELTGSLDALISYIESLEKKVKAGEKLADQLGLWEPREEDIHMLSVTDSVSIARFFCNGTRHVRDTFLATYRKQVE